MTDYYVDSVSGDNGDNGTTQALAWATLEYAHVSGGLGAGDTVWVRRNHSETPSGDVGCAYDGSVSSALVTSGWPRPAIPNTDITEGDWTNGSATVDNIVGITCAYLDHCGRWATAPDGHKYLITRVVDSNTIMVDREYAGSTVTGVSGKFQIEADDNYGDEPADVDGWDSDDHTMPEIDFASNARSWIISSDYYHVYKNLAFRDGGDSGGMLTLSGAFWCEFQGVLLNTDQNGYISYAGYSIMTILFNRCILIGSGSGSSQRGPNLGDGEIILRDCAIYNMGDTGIFGTGGNYYFENVNIGVEQANGDDDIYFGNSGMYGWGRDVKLGGTNGDVHANATINEPFIYFENYGKILGAHKVFYSGNTMEKAAVSGETPNKKVSDDIIKISPNAASTTITIPGWEIKVFEHEFEAATDSKSYKYWLYNDTGDTLNDGDAKGSIFLELEYVDSYDDTSEYTMTKVYSDEASIADAADADDWDYLEVTGIAPATASKVRITCYCGHYTAAGDIFIDPAVVIS